MAKLKPPTPPKTLGADGRRYWMAVTGEYEFGAHELEGLRLASEALDVAAQARAEVAEYGSLTFTTKSGELRPHPGVAQERDARSSFARIVALLKLPDEAGAPRGVGRPGRRF